MKKTILTALVFMISFLGFTVNILADDSVAIAVSCTVPSIPGLNAPFLENAASRQSVVLDNNKQLTDSGSSSQQTVLSYIEEEEQGQETEINSKGEGEIILVRTFYAR
jgi:hypothetical protein